MNVDKQHDCCLRRYKSFKDNSLLSFFSYIFYCLFYLLKTYSGMPPSFYDLANCSSSLSFVFHLPKFFGDCRTSCTGTAHTFLFFILFLCPFSLFHNLWSDCDNPLSVICTLAQATSSSRMPCVSVISIINQIVSIVFWTGFASLAYF